MAIAISSSKPTISRFERNELEFSTDMIIAIKKFLSIEKAPLFEHELSLYRNRMKVWDTLIGTQRLTEARDMQNEMSVILDLPFEQDLYLLFLVTEAMLLSKEYNIPVLNEKLSIAEGLLDNASDDALYLYHLNKGFYYAANAGDYKNFLKHSLMALEYMEKAKRTGTSVLISIGQAYNALGKPYKAIIYFERAKAQSKGDLTDISVGFIMQSLARCYMIIGEYATAEKYLEPALARALSVNAEFDIGLVLSDKAKLSFKKGEYEECLDLYDQSLKHHEQHKGIYLSTLIAKAIDLFKMKKYDKSQEAIERGKAILNEEEHGGIRSVAESDTQEITLNAVGHLLTLDNDTSVEYIKDVAIPYLRANGYTNYEALFFCSQLEAHYTKKRAKTKANAMAAIARDIYRERYESEIEFD